MMKDKIVIYNNIRIGNVIGTKLEHEEDLLISKELKVKRFINKYLKYLNSCEEDDMLEFFKLTGLLIGHEYIEKGTFKRIYFSLNGVYSWDFDKLENKANTYNQHLIVETYVNDIEVYKSSITANKKDIYHFQTKEVIDIDRHKWNLSMFNTKERIKYLKENNYLLPECNDIKDILLDPFNNVLSLTKNGYLYLNDYLYSNGVEYIFELNSTDIKLIYKNMIVEDYSSHCNSLICKRYNKVLYDVSFLVTLENNILCIYLELDLEYNRSIYFRFDGVDDIRYLKESQSLIIIKNEEKINLYLPSIMLLS